MDFQDKLIEVDNILTEAFPDVEFTKDDWRWIWDELSDGEYSAEHVADLFVKENDLDHDWREDIPTAWELNQ